jgi:N-alpha-acetyltransferase 10/11
VRGKVVGYVLSKIEEESDSLPHGHITSISVLRTFRKLGLGYKLMEAVNHDMQHILGAKYVSLHVRESNRAALGLYRDRLKYEVIEIEEGYYADGENAYMMVKFFDESARSEFSKKKRSRKDQDAMKLGEGEH